ncbi:MAG TPA: quinol:electron acceptor oxidoreductase subunit ActD [Pirellulales bacterium]
MTILPNTPHDPLHATTPAPAGTKVAGLLAEFNDEHALVAAAEKVRDAGYVKFDCCSPFPIHGIDEAMGVRPTVLPWLVFVMGLCGTLLAIGFQYWANGLAYPMIISGKPLFAWPANIPVAFELTVLFAGLTAFFGVLGLNGLPQLAFPAFASPRFARATNDKFFLFIDAEDPRYVPAQTLSFVEGLHADAVETIRMPAEPDVLPSIFTYVGLALAILALLPPAIIFNARHQTNTLPRFHFIYDMDQQPRYTAQASSLFANWTDDRATRLPVPGTVARGNLRTDTHLYDGKVDGQFAKSIPTQIAFDRASLDRGQQRFNIYCAVCHGLTGAGDGMVPQRAFANNEPGYPKPTSLIEGPTLTQPVGKIFQTITHGVRPAGRAFNTMPSYGAQIPVEDRWKIVLYIKALQKSYQGTLQDAPAEVQTKLNAQ